MGRTTITRKDYFWERVNTQGPNGCWLWTGTIRTNGYARFAHGGVRNQYGHRVSYELHCGPIPLGKIVRHTCDVPRCVNPNHLMLGTQADNMQDKMERGRHRTRRLNENARRRVTEMTTSGLPVHRVASICGVTERTVRKLAKRLQRPKNSP